MQTNDNNELKEPREHHEEVDELTRIKYFGGHEYDGIKELDNPMPPWLKYIFYVTIIISIVYLTRLVVFKDANIMQKKEYSKEMAAARAKSEKAEKEEASQAAVQPMSQEQILAAGKVTYDKICTVCHGKFGEGLVGPNFTDEYWIHGNKPDDLKKVINEGVIDKGMLSYKSQLSKKQIDQVIAYILSLQGTNPPNPKAPQGEKMAKN